jgi:hypothetical protein
MAGLPVKVTGLPVGATAAPWSDHRHRPEGAEGPTRLRASG